MSCLSSRAATVDLVVRAMASALRPSARGAVGFAGIGRRRWQAGEVQADVACADSGGVGGHRDEGVECAAAEVHGWR